MWSTSDTKVIMRRCFISIIEPGKDVEKYGAFRCNGQEFSVVYA